MLASSIGSYIIVPFEAVRIHSVSQPNFSEKIIGVVKQAIKVRFELGS
jgi:hypothetical protein